MKKQFKKVTVRSIAVLLSIVLSFLSFPFSVFAIDDNLESNSSVSMSNEKDIIELIDERTATTKRFRLEDGSYMVAQYDTDVHYLDEDGTWQNIDNTLAVSGSDITTSDAKIKFAKKTTGNETLFALHDGNRKLTLSLNGAAKKVAGEITNYDSELGEDTTKLEKMTTLNNISASVLYSEILPNTDLEYVIKGKSIKENIIVKSKADAYSYTFTLSLNNLTASLNADNVIEIFDANTEELAYRIPAPVMWDANNALSNDISVSLTDLGNGNYTLMITPSAEWMNDEARAFPVTVDPPIYPASNSTILDFYVSLSESASSTVNSPYLRVGKSHHAYWKLTSLPSLPTSAYIRKATFTTKATSAGEVNGYIGVYDILSSWDSSLTWLTASGNLSENYTDYAEAVNVYVHASTDWIITPIVKKWYAGQNYGLAFAPIQDVSFSGYINIYSNNYSTASNRPSLCIEYVDMKGLEDYWSYTSQSAGFAGSGSINHATGNLVFAIPTLTTTDALMPFTPTLVYNSALADMRYAYPSAQTAYGITSAAAASMPLGFKLNIQETLICKSYVDQNNATKDLYIWADADGTEHCFRSTGSNSVYKDEDGLLLELTANASTVTIKDSGDNVRTFSKLSTQPSGIVSSWYLTSIADKIGNKVVFEVDSSYRPIAIKLVPLAVSPIEQMRLWYNANGKLGAVYNPYSKEAVILRYNGNYLSELLRVHTNSSETINDSFWSSFYNSYPSSYDSGKYIVDAVATYMFDDFNGFLVSAENGLTSYRLTYEYDASLCKVIGVSESAAGDYYTQDDSTYYSVGQGICLSYGTESTVIRTSGTDDILMTSDDLLTTYGFDYYGRSVSCYTTDLNQTVLYGASNGQYVGEENENAKNNLKSSVQTLQHSSNYLLNGGFENSNGSTGAQYWTAASGNVARVPSMGVNESAALRLIAGGSVSYSEAVQEVYLPQGRYTLSAQVRTSNASDMQVYLYVESDYQEFETYVPINENNASNGYVTVALDIEADVTDYYRIHLCMSGWGASEEIYFDQMMLSRTTGVSEFDNVRMGHFETTHGNSPSPLSQWTAFGGTASIVSSGSNSYETFLGDVLKIEGDFMNGGGVTQVVYEASEADREEYDADMASNLPRVFTVSGWGKGTAQSYDVFSSFAIVVDIEYYAGADQYRTETYSFDFSKDITNWQFISGGVATNPAKGLLNKIEISILYVNNPGVGYFDNITLIEDSKTTNVYSYTDAGYLSSYQNGSNWSQSYYNSDNRVIRTVSSDKTMVEYEYNANGQVVYEYHQKYAFFNNQTGVVSEAICLYYNWYLYSLQGQPTFTFLCAYEDGVEGESCIYSQTTYYNGEEMHHFGMVESEIDSLGNTTYYFYDENNGRINAVTYPNGYGVYYEYDGMGNLQAVYPASLESGPMYDYYTGETEVHYAYDSVTKRLDTITTASTQYKFHYDEFGNSTEIEAGGRTLASYEYKKVLVDDGNITDYVPVNGKLDTLTYGNGLKLTLLRKGEPKALPFCYINSRLIFIFSFSSSLSISCTYSARLGWSKRSSKSIFHGFRSFSFSPKVFSKVSSFCGSNAST